MGGSLLVGALRNVKRPCPTLRPGLGIRFGFSLPMPRSSPRRLQFLAQFLVFVPQPIILFLGLLQLPSQVIALGAFHCSLSWHGIVQMSSPLPLINYPASLDGGAQD